VLKRLTQIDALTRAQHHYLRREDEVFYFVEYTARQGYTYGPGNQLITNFKCEVNQRETPRWAFKVDAINLVGQGIAECMNPRALQGTTFVPVPPSKTHDDPAYDDRCVEALRAASRFAGHAIDVRELVVQVESTPASHESEARLHAEELIANYRIDDALAAPPPRDIVVFDDVLTTGSHFKAMQHVLKERFPDIAVRGLFIARRRI